MKRSIVAAALILTGIIGAFVVAAATSALTITLGPNLMPENSIVPEAPAISTESTSTTVAVVASSTRATLIQSLYAELASLEAQIASLETSSNTSTSTPAPSTIPMFSRSLSLGDQGSDVTALQQFLVSQGYLHAVPTGYFGPLTEAAVQAFQTAQGIVSSGTPQTTGYGQVGRKTAAKIASLSGGSGTSTTGTGSTALPLGIMTPIAPGYGGGGGSSGGGGGGGGGSNPTPNVSLTAPASNADISGSSVTLTATASESGGSISSVKFEVGTTTIATLSSSPYTTTWNSNGVSDGTYTLYAVAKDTSGNYATSSISVTTDNGNPVVSITSPSSGSTVSGSSVTLSASASDDVGVQSVQFQVDGTNLDSAITSAPYTTTWNSTGVSDGSNTIKAIVTNVVGATSSASESVSVENTPVALSAISSGSPGSFSATSTWTTNEPATSEVLIGTTTSYGTTYSSASLVTSHSTQISGLSSDTTYHYEVVSTNAAGNTATSSDQTFTTTIPSPVTITLTSGTSWTVPSNWNSASNTIEVIGGGGGGASGTTAGGGKTGGAGGGGQYGKQPDVTLTQGGTVTVQIGQGGAAGTGNGGNGGAGGDTIFNSSATTTASCSGSAVCVQGGQGGQIQSSLAGGAGGSVSFGTATSHNGGAGGNGGLIHGMAGGGGSAGPLGVGGGGGSGVDFGGNSQGGAGGGGADNGSVGVTPSGSAAGAGGANGSGVGSGGAGASSGNSGSTGANENTWGTGVGPGGGGGGGGAGGSPGGNGGNGGTGGGGGGGGLNPTNGGAGGNGIIVITYTPGPPVSNPPVISSIASSTDFQSATITWTTDTNSTSQVNYGLNTSYASSSLNSALVNSHSVILTGLTASTTYHFQVESTDATGHIATSTDQTFTTIPKWADLTNTGVPSGTTLTSASSNTVSSPGTYSDLSFTGPVTITSSNVTLENCLVTGGDSDNFEIVVSSGLSNVLIQDCEIVGAGTNSTQTGTYGVYIEGGSQVTANALNIHGVGTGVEVTGGNNQIIIENSYMHDFGSGPNTHYEGVYYGGGGGADFSLLIQHNTIDNQLNQTAATFIESYSGSVNDVTLNDNILVGGSYPIYVINSGQGAPTNVSITDNHLPGEGSADGGDFDFSGSTPTTSGNVDDASSILQELDL